MKLIHPKRMAGGEPEEPLRADSHDRKMLGSWKEIAAYLGKGVRTVQRWEADLGLPVRRPKGAGKGIVYASSDDLDLWLAVQWAKRSPSDQTSGLRQRLEVEVEVSKSLRQSNQQLLDDVIRNVKGLQEACAALVKSTEISREMRNGLSQATSEVAQARAQMRKTRTRRI